MAVHEQTRTFLFTDLEASTQLWDQHPDAMREALSVHDDLLRRSVATNGGTVVKSTGDGLLATFESATAAVRAAVAAQRALTGTPWLPGVELRVRMGLHQGDATERDGDWFGSDVNRAARITAAAHGGQLLCTEPVARRAREQVDGVDAIDLGSHRLRDLQSEVRLFQLVADGLAAEFPPLRTLDAYRSNLPYELSSFVGRETEIRELADRVRASRLVSVVGVGGVGKTRLALRVASEVLPHFADGVWLCELAVVQDPADLPEAVAAAVGYASPQGVSVRDGLTRFFERKELLLVLDNCEHLVAATARFVAEVTGAAPRLSVLATSREALGVLGEHVSPVAPLSTPDAPDAMTVLASEAGALFEARAREVRGEFAVGPEDAAAIRDLCNRLDGIPLAIELAAARTNVMSVQEVVDRLDQQFRLLTGGRRATLERHQTLRAAIDWSFALLTDEERDLLRRLSLCVGGFDLDAAVALATAAGIDEFDAVDVLGSLVAKSLVERSDLGPTPRFRLLEMIRQFAAEQLATSGISEAARDDHARHYLAVATRLFGATPATADTLVRLESETPNIGAGARWLLASEQTDVLLRFFAGVGFLDPFTLPTVTIDDLGRMAEDLVARTDLRESRGFARAAWFVAVRRFFAGENDAYRDLAEELLACPATAGASTTAIVEGTTALLQGDVARARAAGERSVERARAEGGGALLAWAYAFAATMCYFEDPEAGSAIARDAMVVGDEVGGLARLYPLLSYVNTTRRIERDRALVVANELMDLDETRRQMFARSGRSWVAQIAVESGDVAAGLSTWKEILWINDAEGEPMLFSVALASLAGSLAEVDEAAAIRLGAIADSAAIAHFATFEAFPALAALAAERPAEVAAARAAAAMLSHDEALATVFATIDGLIAARS